MATKAAATRRPALKRTLPVADGEVRKDEIVNVPRTRADLPRARRLVVKVGSSSLTGPDGHLDVDALHGLVSVLAAARAAGQQIVLVSSGAIAAGVGPLRLAAKPRDLAT